MEPGPASAMTVAAQWPPHEVRTSVQFDGGISWWFKQQPMGFYHLVMTNIAMENPNHKWRFLAGKIIYKWAIFHGFVK